MKESKNSKSVPSGATQFHTCVISSISAYTFSTMVWISQLASTKTVWILGFVYTGLSIKITICHISVFLCAHTSMMKWIAEIYEQKSHEKLNGLCNKLNYINRSLLVLHSIFQHWIWGYETWINIVIVKFLNTSSWKLITETWENGYLTFLWDWTN